MINSSILLLAPSVERRFITTMEYTFEVIVFCVLLVDSLGANVMAWATDGKWYKKNFSFLSRHFPKGQGLN